MMSPHAEELQRLGKQLLDGGEPEAARIVLENACLWPRHSRTARSSPVFWACWPHATRG